VTGFEMISREKYKVRYHMLGSKQGDPCTLVFKQSYHKLWLLRSDSGEQRSVMTDDFQNSWKVDAGTQEVTIVFKPREYVRPLMFFSSSVAFLSIAYLVMRMLKK